MRFRYTTPLITLTLCDLFPVYLFFSPLLMMFNSVTLMVAAPTTCRSAIPAVQRDLLLRYYFHSISFNLTLLTSLQLSPLSPLHEVLSAQEKDESNVDLNDVARSGHHYTQGKSPLLFLHLLVRSSQILEWVFELFSPFSSFL